MATRNPKPWKDYGRYGSVGIELVLSIMLGWYGGQWLDGKVGGGHGYITAVGFLVGVYAGFRALFAVAKKMEKDIERAERQARGEDPWKNDATDTTQRPDDAADDARRGKRDPDDPSPPH
jgi:hypothetical protein